MDELIKILKYKRPYNSAEDETCITMHLDVIAGMKSDSFGNRMITIGNKPTTLFSSHTDTVHKTAGIQKLIQDIEKQIIYKDDGECLGADDGAGMWMMLQLINKKIPGLYIFHRGEECGGLGSSYIAHDTPEILEGITKAIAFDRRGTKDIITAQSGGKCCSDEFCTSLSDALDMEHTSARGTFTDTANYTDLIEECTNISIGYYDEHRKEESLDYEYLFALKDKLLTVDFEALVVKREKGDRGYADISPYGLSGKYTGLSYRVPTEFTLEEANGFESLSHADCISFVMNYPHTAADMLFDNGLTNAEIRLSQNISLGYSDF